MKSQKSQNWQGHEKQCFCLQCLAFKKIKTHLYLCLYFLCFWTKTHQSNILLSHPNSPEVKSEMKTYFRGRASKKHFMTLIWISRVNRFGQRKFAQVSFLSLALVCFVFGLVYDFCCCCCCFFVFLCVLFLVWFLFVCLLHPNILFPPVQTALKLNQTLKCILEASNLSLSFIRLKDYELKGVKCATYI